MNIRGILTKIKEFSAHYMFIFGCLCMLGLFAYTVFLFTWPYKNVLTVADVSVMPDVINPGEEINIYSSYEVSMDVPIEISISYACESGQPLSNFQNRRIYFAKGEYKNIQSRLKAPTRLVTEKCQLQYDLVIMPNPFRRLTRIIKSKEFTLVGSQESVGE